MPDFRITYYTLSDGQQTATVTAASIDAAIQFLKEQPYSIFAQLKEYKIMTTPNQPTTPAQQAAEQFRADLRADLAEIMDELHSQRAELVNVRADLEAIRAGLTQASQPAPTVGTFAEMVIDSIIMTYTDKGEAAYKATGAPYNKFGVRVWPETLPALGIDPNNLKPGPNPQAQPIRARVLMKTNESGQPAPQKVTGKA